MQAVESPSASELLAADAGAAISALLHDGLRPRVLELADRCHRLGFRHRLAAGFKSDARASRFSPAIVLIQTSTSSLLGPPLRFPVGDG